MASDVETNTIAPPALDSRGRDRDQIPLPVEDSQLSSASTSPERAPDDDDDDDTNSFLQDANESQSSLEVSLEEMELDPIDYELQRKLCPVSRLPAELMIAIFSRLSTPADVLSSLLTCKSWARNSVELLWLRPRTDRWDKFQTVVETLKKKGCYFAYWELIKRLNLTSLREDVTDEALAHLDICKHIERLTLANCTSLTDASIVPLIHKNTHLTSLDLCGVDMITDATLKEVASYCWRLQGLNVGSCTLLTDDSLAEVAKTCKRLKRVKLNYCHLLTDTTIRAFAKNCPELVEFDVAGCKKVTDFSIPFLISDSHQLRELRLSYCDKLTDLAFTRLISSTKQYDALRILDLTDCPEVGDAALQRISTAFPRLRTLVLAKCRAITDRGIMAMSNLGHNLHFIHLGHCARITDYGLSHLIKACNRIRYIDLACCTNLTDESVKMLAELPKLKRIGLVKCQNITDRSIIALSEAKHSQSGSSYKPAILERLHLSYCTNLTISGVRMMLMRCPRLTHLSLSGVQAFLREDLTQFCREAPTDFNDHQREVFCVFSGQKVNDLRAWLRDQFETPSSSRPASEPEDPRDAVGSLGGLASWPAPIPPPHGAPHIHGHHASHFPNQAQADLADPFPLTSPPVSTQATQDPIEPVDRNVGLDMFQQQHGYHLAHHAHQQVTQQHQQYHQYHQQPSPATQTHHEDGGSGDESELM